VPVLILAGANQRGCVSAIDSNGRTIWIADAHRDGQRFIVRADEKLTAFLELESAPGDFADSLLSLWLLSA
jgi:hypothetical protein